MIPIATERGAVLPTGIAHRLAVLVALAGVVTACGGGDAGRPNGGIEVSGSSTVEPITSRVAEAFWADNPRVGISVEGPGTGDGFARFCNGETDISDASRPIKGAEEENCAAAGVEWVELVIAIDGISVLTSLQNEAVSCLGFADLYALLGPESEGFTSWSDANDLAAELGAKYAPYPDAPLVVTAPGEESGTFDTFVELALEDVGEERLGDDFAVNPTRADYEASPNDNVIINGIAGNPTSLGWAGYAFYEENRDVVAAIEVDGGNGCVAPTAETIASFDYPLSRPLFIYVNVAEARTRPVLSDFVDFYLSDEGLQAVAAAGYVQLPNDAIAATRATWEAVQ